ncbi:MAG: long-chain fatty acid--CoA ligase [Rikenellaceae bacterium]|nr:long-chain fatty acid--CoA ligase [Rikenellaceae bacterium]
MAFKTMYDLVRHSIEKFSEKMAFKMLDGEEVSFSEVGERIKKVQQMLTSAGLKAGDKVALYSSSMPNWGVSYFSVVTAGMVVVPILPGFSGEEVAKILEHSESKALLVSDKLYAKLPKASVEALNIVIRTKNLKVLSQRVEGEGSTTVPQPDDLASIIYTSGTTSSPKGVMLSQQALAIHADLCQKLFPINTEDSFLSVLPMSHVYECSLGLIFPFSQGVPVFYLDRPPAAAALVPALRRVRPTIMLIVPLIIEKIFRSQVLTKFTANGAMKFLYGIRPVQKMLHKVAGKKLMEVFGGRLRFLGVGGAKLDTTTEQFLVDAAFPHGIGYGLTETAPLLAGAVPLKKEVGSTGPAVPYVELRLDNINPDTQQGEVVAKSPCVMMGYYKNPEATAEVIDKDGWFHTGDLGQFDSENRLHIKGRLKNMILGPGGENIYPEDIESVINQHVTVSESLVTELDGRLVALVQFNTEQIERMLEDWRDQWRTKKEAIEAKTEELRREIQQYVNEKVSQFSRLSDVVEQKEEFIKTPSMKIRRFLYKNNLHPEPPKEDSTIERAEEIKD